MAAGRRRHARNCNKRIDAPDEHEHAIPSQGDVTANKKSAGRMTGALDFRDGRCYFLVRSSTAAVVPASVCSSFSLSPK